MGKYPIAKELEQYQYVPFTFFRPILASANTYLRFRQAISRPPEGFRYRQQAIDREDGTQLKITIIEPKSKDRCRPAILYFHGGAFVLESSNLHTRLIQTYAQALQCSIVVVHYRLAPKYQFPANIEDGELAARWLFSQAATQGIDPQKIAIAGDSAGAYVASIICQKWQQQVPTFCLQVLVYPVLDPLQASQSITNYVDTPIWDAKRNAQMWANYIPQTLTRAQLIQPLQAEKLANIPPTYIEVAEFDCLHDEGVTYAQKLQQAGIQVSLAQPKATIHGYELAFNAEFVQTAIMNRINAFKRAFQMEEMK